MSQMNTIFRQFWPAVAAHIERNHGLGPGVTPSQTFAAEAAYAIGVAIGLSLRDEQSAPGGISASVPGWRADACGELNWPRITSLPGAIAGSRR